MEAELSLEIVTIVFILKTLVHHRDTEKNSAGGQKSVAKPLHLDPAPKEPELPTDHREVSGGNYAHPAFTFLVIKQK